VLNHYSSSSTTPVAGELCATADNLRLARQAQRAFLDLWLAGKLSGQSDDLDRLVADMEMDGFAVSGAGPARPRVRRFLIE